jgi:hypothetical protein
VERQEGYLVDFLSRGEPTLSDQYKPHKVSPETDAFWQFVLHLPLTSSTPKWARECKARQEVELREI